MASPKQKEEKFCENLSTYIAFVKIGLKYCVFKLKSLSAVVCSIYFKKINYVKHYLRYDLRSELLKRMLC